MSPQKRQAEVSLYRLNFKQRRLMLNGHDGGMENEKHLSSMPRNLFISMLDQIPCK